MCALSGVWSSGISAFSLRITHQTVEALTRSMATIMVAKITLITLVSVDGQIL